MKPVSLCAEKTASTRETQGEPSLSSVQSTPAAGKSRPSAKKYHQKSG